MVEQSPKILASEEKATTTMQVRQTHSWTEQSSSYFIKRGNLSLLVAQSYFIKMGNLPLLVTQSYFIKRGNLLLLVTQSYFIKRGNLSLLVAQYPRNTPTVLGNGWKYHRTEGIWTFSLSRMFEFMGIHWVCNTTTTFDPLLVKQTERGFLYITHEVGSCGRRN